MSWADHPNALLHASFRLQCSPDISLSWGTRNLSSLQAERQGLQNLNKVFHFTHCVVAFLDPSYLCLSIFGSVIDGQSGDSRLGTRVDTRHRWEEKSNKSLLSANYGI